VIARFAGDARDFLCQLALLARFVIRADRAWICGVRGESWAVA
jgi:hypothetical protein